MNGIDGYDISHLLGGLMLASAFVLLYQERLIALLRTFALQSVLLGLAVGWQAWSQDRPHLYITASIALLLKAVVVPLALDRMIHRLGIQRDVDKAVGVGATMLAGLALTALSLLLVLRATPEAPLQAREGLAIALAVVLMGLLLMITRHNAITQVIGFMSIENGLILGAAGTRGMPLVVEISVAFSVVIALLVVALSVFRIRERFDTVDLGPLEAVRGDAPDALPLERTDAPERAT